MKREGRASLPEEARRLAGAQGVWGAKSAFHKIFFFWRRLQWFLFLLHGKGILESFGAGGFILAWIGLVSCRSYWLEGACRWDWSFMEEGRTEGSEREICVLDMDGNFFWLESGYTLCVAELRGFVCAFTVFAFSFLNFGFQGSSPFAGLRAAVMAEKRVKTNPTEKLKRPRGQTQPWKFVSARYTTRSPLPLAPAPRPTRRVRELRSPWFEDATLAKWSVSLDGVACHVMKWHVCDPLLLSAFCIAPSLFVDISRSENGFSDTQGPSPDRSVIWSRLHFLRRRTTYCLRRAPGHHSAGVFRVHEGVFFSPLQIGLPFHLSLMPVSNFRPNRGGNCNDRKQGGRVFVLAPVR